MEALASVQLTAQNDCARMLEVTAYALTSGQWDPTAAPSLGQQVPPGTTGCWLSLTSLPSTAVAGSLALLVAQAGQLLVQWNLSLSAPFAPTLAKQNWVDPDVGGALVVNQGDYAHVWVQLLVTPVVTVRQGQALEEIAGKAGTDVATIVALNQLDSLVLMPGQRLLVSRGVLDASAALWRITGGC